MAIDATDHASENCSFPVLGDPSMKYLPFKQTSEPVAILALEDAPTPKPGANEVLLRTLLAPIDPSDLHVLRGRFGRQPQRPAAYGLEVIGGDRSNRGKGNARRSSPRAR
jgi:hypothetical protein